MKIVLFTHPSFLRYQSMPRFAQMIVNGMHSKGHEIKAWSPKPFFFKWALNKPKLEKWFGYLDQFVVFPIQVKIRLLSTDKNTLFVFADNALGPWVPLVSNRPHVVHCHDFLAQQAALGMLAESKTAKTGTYYQSFIRWGYRQAENFICISKKTQTDLLSFLDKKPKTARVVYNGLNQNFSPADNVQEVRIQLSSQFNIDLSQGFLLHVGGNAFYKNKMGVLEIYDQWNQDFAGQIPLLLIGEVPSEQLKTFASASAATNRIHFISNIDDKQLQLFYQAASVMVFPSLYEGFGWPIVEAMASGTLVITTNEDPMKEVAGHEGFYVAKRPSNTEELLNWKKKAAQVVENVLQLSPEQENLAIAASVLRSKLFSAEEFMDAIEIAYQEILETK
ncbi:glycosyltransferase [Flavobacterium sp. 7A]|uniref:glycosyltransferase n=1 Tax=Flavobacterium sp. 7A TaxID=2940571 RepID=UPI0022279ACC|nr:glycosyltransferase [Flavobacterium sp. 7A]MCW2118499.1 glycosyltransferase involved in cell wall biosynthesis [Flavobacterium sp. 7A]